MDRPFLDANVLYSAAYKDGAPLRELWKLADIELLTSAYAADEVLCNLAIDKPARLEALEHLLGSLTLAAGAAPAAVLPEGIDLAEKDRPILLSAIEAGATHLLTGDKRHFGTYYGQRVGGVLILRPGDYLRSRKQSNPGP